MALVNFTSKTGTSIGCLTHIIHSLSARTKLLNKLSTYKQASLCDENKKTFRQKFVLDFICTHEVVGRLIIL